MIPTEFSKCGVNTNGNMIPRVIGGINVEEKSHPWQAAIMLHHSPLKQPLFKCGGTLISNRFVLTSAACFHKLES